MALPDAAIFELLRDEFVVGWRNIEREEFCGSSLGYARTQTAVGTTNGAGPHNVQIFVLSPDRVVLHALPGFWHPDDLHDELRFSQLLWRLWRDADRTRAQKDAMFARLHAAQLRRQSELTTARSTWQGFDRFEELARANKGEERDTFVRDAAGAIVMDGRAPRMKPINVLVHERMARRPFVWFAEFDVARFVDYGKKHYDNNAGIDRRHRRFVTLDRLMRKRAREAARSRRARP